jgi:arylsulfatase A-like enzyme
MMDDYYTHLRHGENFMRRQREVISPEGHATDLFTEWSCDWIRGQAGKPEPFFLYLAYNAPHGPIQPPADWLKRIRDRSPEMPEKRAKFVALTEHLDDGIGRVLGTLNDLGVEENTVVIFTSDNGGDVPSGASAGLFRSHKGHMYEGGLRVPCAVRWPGVVKPASRTAFPALTLDLYSTLVDIARQPVQAGTDGVSLLPTLRGEVQPVPDRVQYFVRREGGVQFFGKTNDAVIRGRWKLVHDGPMSPLELFDLESDPAETTSLVEKAPKVFRELVLELSRQLQLGGAVPWQRANSAK